MDGDGDQDVLWLEVPVDDAPPVQVLQGVDYLVHDVFDHLQLLLVPQRIEVVVGEVEQIVC